MAIRKKLDSNETSAYYAEEESIGVLPAVAVWKPLEPNSYNDFGGELTLLARNPINSSRQRKKGVITDLDAAGGLNQDFTQDNMQDMLQGFMFASFRNKAQTAITSITATVINVTSAAGFKVGNTVAVVGSSVSANNKSFKVTAITGNALTCAGLVADPAPRPNNRVSVCGLTVTDAAIVTTGAFPSLTATGAAFDTMGLTVGEYIYVGGDLPANSFANDTNNGFKRINTITPDALILDFSPAAMVAEVKSGDLIIHVGRVLKNELGVDIVRRSYQLERQLGAPDTAQPTQVQSEYLRGAVANEFAMSIGMADKINSDISFVAMDNEQRTAVQGVKAGTRLPLVESDAFNTSTDFSFMRLAVIDPNNEAPEALFAYLTELEITINNNVSPNKAVAILGAFDMTAGTFEVTASATAYFSTVEAVSAVRRNEDVTLSFGVVKQNAGFVCDLPLVALSDARLEVALNEPIMLPLTIDAATAAKLNANSDYTLMWCFFDYLPNVAG